MKIKIGKKLKTILFVLAFLLVLATPPFSSAQTENEVTGYFFYGEGCPHCAKANALLNILETKYPTFSVKSFETYFNRENADLLQKVSTLIGEPINGVPFLVIGDGYFAGYSDSYSPEAIEGQLQKCLTSQCPDLMQLLTASSLPPPTLPEETKPTENPTEPESNPTQNPLDIPEQNTSPEEAPVETSPNIKNVAGENKIIDLPFLGEVDALSFSLPILTVVMGALDGFNPCAMWTLLFLISLLIGMENRRRMWVLGIAFIVASASVYFLFMVAWLNIILVLGFVFWVRSAIGVLSMAGGGYNIRKFFREKDGGCEVTGSEKRQKVFEKLKEVVKQQNFWFALVGIIALAFVVNLVELVCSAGLPAIYTQVLAMNELPSWQYYGYILLYIFFFMIDDLFVFFVAMWTLEMTGITTKYARYSHLVGGILMLIIGFLLIFFPEFLMFG